MVQQFHFWLSRETENINAKKISVHCMFIAALFTIVKTWKQSRCPLMDEWIKKMWHTHTRVCVCVCIYIYILLYILFSEVLTFVTWMDLEGSILSQISHIWKRKIPYDITYTWNLKDTYTNKQISDLRSSHCCAVEIQLVSMSRQVQSLASLSGWGIWHCCEL